MSFLAALATFRTSSSRNHLFNDDFKALLWIYSPENRPQEPNGSLSHTGHQFACRCQPDFASYCPIRLEEAAWGEAQSCPESIKLLTGCNGPKETLLFSLHNADDRGSFVRSGHAYMVPVLHTVPRPCQKTARRNLPDDACELNARRLSERGTKTERSCCFRLSPFARSKATYKRLDTW